MGKKMGKNTKVNKKNASGKQKAGESGESCKFISRAKAIRKLQVTLKDFRRLCILKGVYPREPPQKLKKRNLSYYHIKDINFLEHDRVLQKFRDIKAHIKKIKRAKARNNELKVKKLQKSIPKVTLNHLVKERYPTFTDALRDLDDPLCLMNLFSAFSAHKDLGIPREKVQQCIKLAREFNMYIIKSKSLRKVFLSIKGIYYQAEIQGQSITWIQPYQLPANLPIDVDYKVMLTFQEFYETLLRFVNFKLFASLNIKYPLEVDASVDEANHFCYKSYIVKNLEGNLFDEENQKYQIDEKFQKEIEDQTEGQFAAKDLFKNLVFFLSTEVPRYSLEFIILAMGGQVHWAGDESGVQADDKKITHYITDRKPEHIKFLKNREYVQPQWIYDSVNNAIQLPIKDYAPGKILPPHLSPFGTDVYKTEREKQIKELKGEAIEQEEEEDDEEIKKMLEEEQNQEDDEEDEEEEIEEDDEDEEELNEEDFEDDGEEEENDDEEEEDSSDEDEDDYDSEQLSSEVVDEVEGGDKEEDEEEEYDYEKDKKKKQVMSKKQERENRELAKNMMTKKNKTLYKLMQHKKEKAKKEANALKVKAERLKRKQALLDKRKNATKQ